jgi:hypothetical protein
MEGLLLLLLEAGVALAILLFIVWWTWPRRGPRTGDSTHRQEGKDKQDNN